MSHVCFHLHPHPFPHPSNARLLHIRKPNCNFHSISISNHRFLLLSWPRHLCNSRRWDSGAKSYGTKDFKFNRNAEDEVDDKFDDDVDQWSEILEDYIDSIWILKVFRSYGWMLPPVILSLLLANGLKAFLMALALPVGQSTLTFAFQKMQNIGKNKPKRNTKTKKGRTPRKVKFEEATRGVKKKKKGDQSWVSKKDVSVSDSDRSVAYFGGWDELETGREAKEVLDDIGSSVKDNL